MDVPDTVLLCDVLLGVPHQANARWELKMLLCATGSC